MSIATKSDPDQPSSLALMRPAHPEERGRSRGQGERLHPLEQGSGVAEAPARLEAGGKPGHAKGRRGNDAAQGRLGDALRLALCKDPGDASPWAGALASPLPYLICDITASLFSMAAL